jgi:2-polyprenyl-3-methyl-5-hydroxy-6-metoxy-1,4-benzoquinol methylase
VESKLNNFREQHFDWVLESAKKHPPLVLPILTAENYVRDPRSLLFKLARYKTVAKLLDGIDQALEIGCGDGFAAPLVRQQVKELTIVDVDKEMVRLASEFLRQSFDIAVLELGTREATDYFEGRTFGGIYCLDVLEHVSKDEENDFMRFVIDKLNEDGVFIAGIPSLEVQKFTTAQNRIGHINCKPTLEFVEFFQLYFRNVFCFGMNDENFNTGFIPLRAYNFYVCTFPKIDL